MDQNQVYLIKSGSNSFVETESEITIGINGGKLGIGTTSPEAYLHVTGNTQIDGDLTVKGNFTTVDSTTIQVDDKNIELGVGATTDAAADGGGITLHGATNKTFNWADSTDAWTSSENLHLANGKHFSADKLQALDTDGLSLFDNNASGIIVKAGKVGVHNSGPVYDLDVVGSGNFGSLYVDGNSVLTGTAADLGKWSDGSTAGEIYYNGGNVGINTNDPAYTLDVVGGGNFTSLNVQGNSVLTGSADDLSRWSDGSTAGEIYYNGGNVGINTNDPAATLDVNGSLNVEGSFTVRDEFDFGSNGAVGGVSPAAVDDIIKWNGTKWVAGANPGGAGAGGGEVPSALINGLISGQSIQSIAFLDTYDTAPRIATELEIDGEGSIIPYVISGVSTTGYNLIFSQEIPNNNYKIHTVFGGKDVYWETGASNSLAYNDGDVSLQRNLTVGGNLTVNGTQTIVNTETVEIEDHNLVIAANTGYNQLTSEYPGAGDAYAGILWGTGDAGAASPVSLTYQSNKGFAFEGGNVGIGTTNPKDELHVNNASSASIITVTSSDTSSARLYLGDQVNKFRAGLVYNNQDESFALWGYDAAANTAERMRIDSAGHVGIGTTNPNLTGLQLGTALVVSSATGGDIVAHKSGSSVNVGDICGSLLIANSDTDGAEDHFVGMWGKASSTNGSQNLHFAAGRSGYEGDAPHMTILSNGNVGIGTTNPGGKLHVTDLNVSIGSVTVSDTGNILLFAGGTDLDTKISNGDRIKVNNEIFTVSNVQPTQLTLSDTPTTAGTFGAFIDNNALVVTSTGKVSIGHTTSSQQRLSISGSVATGASGNSGIAFHSSSTDLSNATKQRFLAYNAATDNMEIYKYTNGSYNGSILTIDSSSNVGIGTSSPSGKLHVSTSNTLISGTVSTVAADILEASGSNFVNELSVGDQLRIEGKSTYTVVSINSATQVQLSSNITAEGGENLYRVNREELFYVSEKTKKVGIGTTSPACKLHIDGLSGTVGLPSLALYDDTSQRYGLNVSTDSLDVSALGSNGTLKFFTGGSKTSINERMRIDSAGNVGIGTTDPSAELHVNNDSTSSTIRLTSSSTETNTNGAFLRLDSSGDFILNNKDSGVTRFLEQGNDVMIIDSNGNVGIGTTNPTVKLMVEENGAPAHIISRTINTSSTHTGWGNYLQAGTVGTSINCSAVMGTYRSDSTEEFAGTVRLTDRGAVSRFLWLDTSAVLRTSTSLSNIGSNNGEIIGTQTSDERLKDIEDGFEYGLSHVLQLQPIAYTQENDANRKLGFGAQTTQKIIPESVFDTGDCIDGYDVDPEDEMKQTPRSDDTRLGMEYVQLIPVLTKAIQEQQQIIDELKSQNESLAARISALES